MTRRMNRAIQRPHRLAFVCFFLLAFCSLLVASDEGDHLEHPSEATERDTHHHEDPPITQAEDISTQEKEDPRQAEDISAQEKEDPPSLKEEAPPLPKREPPLNVKSEENDASLFEVKVFECTAPLGTPATDREGRLPPSAILTLCFRPQHEDTAELQSIESMEFTVPNGPTQKAIQNNESVGPMTRLICPMVEDPDLCIAATKLSDDFFAKAYNMVAAVGQLNVLVDSEQRRVPFRYEFSTSQAPKLPPVEHDIYEMPATPPSFPCSQEVRLWLLAALVLTLLEFAFSPSDSDKSTDDTNAAHDGTSNKKKKPKKE